MMSLCIFIEEFNWSIYGYGFSKYHYHKAMEMSYFV
jgi:hypothetical protein